MPGAIFGGSNPRAEIPALLSLYQAGKLNLDDLITTKYQLEDINLGYQDMRDGKNIRGMIEYGDGDPLSRSPGVTRIRVATARPPVRPPRAGNASVRPRRRALRALGRPVGVTSRLAVDRLAQQILAIKRLMGEGLTGGAMTFEEFVQQRLPPLLRFATVLCGERGLAEDISQDVLARLYARWSRIDELRNIDAYVRRMIVNEYLSWRRTWARVIPSSAVQPHELVRDHAVEHADRDALITELARLAP